jgi:hypothetical protein
VSKTERIYALLVEANPVPDPEALPERLVEQRLTVVAPESEPMQTEKTVHRQQARQRKRWIPALAAAVVVVAAIVAGVLFLIAGDDPEVADDRGQAAVVQAESYLAALNGGDADAALALLGADAAADEVLRSNAEFNAFVTATYPWEVRGCEPTFSSDEYVSVGCSLVITDPVFGARGVGEVIAPFFVYDDGHMEWRPFQGANFSLANQAYTDYLRLNALDEYEASCWPPAYPTGSVNHDGGIAFTRACAELLVPHSRDVAEWVRLGRPGS